MEDKIHKHLMIGALPPPVGGTTVLLNQLIGELSGFTDIDLTVINTTNTRRNLSGKFIVFFTVLFMILKRIRSVNSVSFHGSINGALQFFPVLRIICYIFKKPVMLRAFGGDFDEKYMKLGGVYRILLNWFMLSAEMLLFETHRSVNYFKVLTDSKVYWYANSRPFNSSLTKKPSKKNKLSPLKVVFIGHVKPSKGVRELVSASDSCSVDIVVDIYGPISEGIQESELNTVSSNYKGVLKPDEILSVLEGYDVLVLPTYYYGEGYPGVILEAYTQALPVISTNWRCIPEIVSDECGLLVEPENVTALKQALDKIGSNTELYDTLSEGALRQAHKFSSHEWTSKYKVYLNELARSTT